MEKEYSHEERLIISRSGSSARVVRGEELDPAIRRRKDAETGNTDRRYVEMFCERYRDRGIAGRIREDAARQEKKEALNRAITPGAFVKTDTLEHIHGSSADSYRSGVSDGKRYMTVDDFDRYFHAQRDYKNPQYSRKPVVNEGYVRAMAETRAEAGGLTSPKKAGWLTDTDKLPAFVQKLLTYKALAKLNEWAGETFPRESHVVSAKETSKTGRRAIPVGLVATLVTVAVSMSMVISSTVLVSQSTRELSQLKEEISAREAIMGELSDQLDLKNDMLTIKDKATSEYGMVNEKYLDGVYLDENAEDYIEVFDKDEDAEEKSGLSALLSAFGFGD